MNVYIANFGYGNYEWPKCFERNTVATMIYEDGKPFYHADDRQGYIDWCIANCKTAIGLTPTRAVASRWFGSLRTIDTTEGDVWIHRAKDQIWWTISKPDPSEWYLQPAPELIHKVAQVYVCHKPCEPWSNHNRKGNRLEWGTVHPKAKHFLFTEGTLQQLSEDNAAYAIAFIAGEDLATWESQPDWKTVLDKAKKNPGIIYNSWQKTVWRIVHTVKNTTANSNGQTVERVLKNKEVRFSDEELTAYIEALRESQEGLCAISGIPMQCDGDSDDSELLYSLDRVDSDGHYESGNLQLVCRFINRWKSDSDNASFRKLINLLKSNEH